MQYHDPQLAQTLHALFDSKIPIAKMLVFHRNIWSYLEIDIGANCGDIW